MAVYLDRKDLEEKLGWPRSSNLDSVLQALKWVLHSLFFSFPFFFFFFFSFFFSHFIVWKLQNVSGLKSCWHTQYGIGVGGAVLLVLLCTYVPAARLIFSLPFFPAMAWWECHAYINFPVFLLFFKKLLLLLLLLPNERLKFCPSTCTYLVH